MFLTNQQLQIVNLTCIHSHLEGWAWGVTCPSLPQAQKSCDWGHTTAYYAVDRKLHHALHTLAIHPS